MPRVVAVLLLALLAASALAEAAPPPPVPDGSCSGIGEEPFWLVACSCGEPLKAVCGEKTCKCTKDGGGEAAAYARGAEAAAANKISSCARYSPFAKPPFWAVQCLCEQPLKPVCGEMTCSCVDDGSASAAA